MSKFVGLALPIGAEQPKAAEKPKKAAQAKKGGRLTKAELVARLEELGVEAPEGATNPQLKALIDEAEAAQAEADETED